MTLIDLPWVQRAGFVGDFARYADNQMSWPDVLRWKGSVLLPTLIPVSGMSLFTLLIYVGYEKLDLNITIPLSVCKSTPSAVPQTMTGMKTFLVIR